MEIGRRVLVALGKAEATAELLDVDAPRTSNLVWELLPLEGKAGHSIDSGKEVFMNLDIDHGFLPENQTIYEIPGDVVMYYKPTVPPPADPPRPVISVIYDRDTQIRSLRGPVPVNLFARIVAGLDQMGREAIRMKKEGYDRMKIIRA